MNSCYQEPEHHPLRLYHKLLPGILLHQAGLNPISLRGTVWFPLELGLDEIEP